jgi:hypothetical protein
MGISATASVLIMKYLDGRTGQLEGLPIARARRSGMDGAPWLMLSIAPLLRRRG